MVELSTRNTTGDYERKSAMRGYLDSVPSEMHAPKYLSNDINVTLQAKSLDDRAATFLVAHQTQKQLLNATSQGGHVFFNDGTLKVTVTLQGSSRPPFVVNDQRLRLPVTIYKIDPTPEASHQGTHIRSYRILDSKTSQDTKLLSDLGVILADRKNLDVSGADCFDPGLACRFGLGADSVDVVICLQCGWMHVYDSPSDNTHLEYGLSEQGKALLRSIYQTTFK